MATLFAFAITTKGFTCHFLCYGVNASQREKPLLDEATERLVSFASNTVDLCLGYRDEIQEAAQANSERHSRQRRSADIRIVICPSQWDIGRGVHFTAGDITR